MFPEVFEAMVDYVRNALVFWLPVGIDVEFLIEFLLSHVEMNEKDFSIEVYI